MLTWGVLKNVNQVVQRVVFLHEDLMKLPSFPRKALEAELDLYSNGEMGKVQEDNIMYSRKSLVPNSKGYSGLDELGNESVHNFGLFKSQTLCTIKVGYGSFVYRFIVGAFEETMT